MFAFVLTWFTGLGLSPKIAKIVAIASAVALLCAGCVGLKVIYDHRIISKHDTVTNIQVLQKAAPANDTAAEARASDTITLHEQAKERSDAIAKESSTPPTGADLALNCHRLREAGSDPSSFPACRGR
jgi:hypothetical protein